MHSSTILDRLFLAIGGDRRPRRRLTPSVRPLEGRQLLSASPSVEPVASATMTQTATFPNLESLPNVATQAFLYFSAPMGTLTEVDVVTSGSFSTQFEAENLGSTSSNITGTTSANLTINLPSGPIPLVIPSVTEAFSAAPFDGTLNYGGTSGNDFAPATSTSPTQTAVLTSPADLAAFTGQFRIPLSVSGHTSGIATSTNNDLSDNFSTQTSATITLIYHYTPNLPILNPPSSTGSGGTTPASSPSPSTGSSPAASAPTAPSGSGSSSQPLSTQPQDPSTQGSNDTSTVAHKSSHKVVHHTLSSRVRKASGVYSSKVKTHSGNRLQSLTAQFFRKAHG